MKMRRRRKTKKDKKDKKAFQDIKVDDPKLQELIEEYQHQIEKLNKKLDKKSSKLKKYKKQLKHSEKEQEDIIMEDIEMSGKINELEDQRNADLTTIIMLEKSLIAKNNEITQLIESNQDFERRLKEGCQAFETELATQFGEQLLEAQGRNESLRETTENLQSVITEHLNREKHLVREKHELEERNKKLTKEVGALKSQSQKSEHTSEEQTAKFHERIDKFEKLVQQKDDTIFELMNKVEFLENELIEAREQKQENDIEVIENYEHNKLQDEDKDNVQDQGNVEVFLEKIEKLRGVNFELSMRLLFLTSEVERLQVERGFRG